MQVRQAAAADLAALKHLYDEHLALLVQGDKRILAEDVQWVGRASGGVWVGEAGGAIGGYLSAWWADNTWQIDHMALDAHTYYPGLARALVSEFRQTAALHGAAEILTRVPVHHPVEQAFWRAIGAVRTPRPAPVGYEWMLVGL